MIGAALVVAALVGVGAFVLLNKDDAPDDSLSTVEMKSAVRELLGRVPAETGEASYLTACPAGDLAGLWTRAPEAIRSVELVLDQPQAFVFQPSGDGELPLFNCTLDTEDYTQGVGLGAGESVPDFREDLVRVLPEFDLTFNDERGFRGGTIIQFCAQPKDSETGVRAFCEADWFDENVWFGVFVASPDQSSTDAETWLIEILPDVILTVPTVAPTVELDGE